MSLQSSSEGTHQPSSLEGNHNNNNVGGGGGGTVLKYIKVAENKVDNNNNEAEGGEEGGVVLIGKKSILKSILNNKTNTELVASLIGFESLDHTILTTMMDSISGPSGIISNFFPTNNNNTIRRLSLCLLPDETSRNEHPMSLHKLSSFISKACPSSSSSSSSRVFVILSNGTTPAPVASAIAKAFPLYTRKTEKIPHHDNDDDDDNHHHQSLSSYPPHRRHLLALSNRTIFISFLTETLSDATLSDSTNTNTNNNLFLTAAQATSDGVQLACRLVDTPPEELTTDAFSKECQWIVQTLSKQTDSDDGTVTMKEIVGTELRDLGYGGLYNVGRAATCPPRLIILSYDPSESEEAESSLLSTVALVGKGIVYDTGGLSLKSKDGMSGMKHDMGGAAGLLGGFYAAVKIATSTTTTTTTTSTQKYRLRLILCLAENAIGPNAFRNDDILTLYSGKTVEVNNCDAEGRLVLGDGVAHASRHFFTTTPSNNNNNKNNDDDDGTTTTTELDHLILDMATLTGAQLITSGKRHAGILANNIDLEQRIMNAGKKSGDLCYPLLYCPELAKEEFKSDVADMRNSVKDRKNAQCSCAGHFIEEHLHPMYEGGWIHVDMAGPGWKDKRGTGYGVGLILALLGVEGF